MSAIPAQPQFGPFADTEVSIYCDKSRHEGQSSQRYMVIGGSVDFFARIISS